MARGGARPGAGRKAGKSANTSPLSRARARGCRKSKAVAGGQGRTVGDRSADPVREKCQDPAPTLPLSIPVGTRIERVAPHLRRLRRIDRDQIVLHVEDLVEQQIVHRAHGLQVRSVICGSDHGNASARRSWPRWQAPRDCAGAGRDPPHPLRRSPVHVLPTLARGRSAWGAARMAPPKFPPSATPVHGGISESEEDLVEQQIVHRAHGLQVLWRQAWRSTPCCSPLSMTMQHWEPRQIS
jgi:hypothetical protein